MFTLRQLLFLASFALTLVLVERTAEVLIDDTERALFATFLLTLAGVILGWTSFMIRTHFERLEKITRDALAQQQAATIIAAVQPSRLHSVDRN